jgi:hypothetical protein
LGIGDDLINQNPDGNISQISRDHQRSPGLIDQGMLPPKEGLVADDLDEPIEVAGCGGAFGHPMPAPREFDGN